MDLFTLFGKIAIESGDANTEMDNMIGKAQNLQNALNGTSDTAESTGDAITDSATKTATGTSRAVSAMQVALGNLATQGFNKAYNYGKSFFQTGFEFNTNMEKWTASFKTYLGGDLEEAVVLVERLKQFAVDTPLSLQETMDQATKLLATGTAPDKLISVLNMIGDLSQGSTETFSRVATAYWQAMSAGALKAQDANQMAQAGVPIWQIMTDYYNAIGRDGFNEWTVAMTREVPSQASLPNSTIEPITADEMNAALMMATSANGMYFNAMNNLMDTEYGKAQKMQDAYEQAAGAATKAIFDVFSSDTIPALNNILEQLNEWATENPTALTNLSEAFSSFATGGLQALLDSLTGLLSFWNDHRAEFDSLLVMLGGIALYSGHPAAGTALIATGAFDAYNDAKKQMEEGSAVGQALMTDPEIAAAVQSGTTGELEGRDWFDYNVGGPFVQFMHNLFPGLVVDPADLEEIEAGYQEDRGGGRRFGTPEDEEGSIGGSIKQLNENMHNLNMLFASASGMPERNSEETGRASWIGDTLRDALSGVDLTRGMSATPYEQVDNAANTSAILGALSAIQGAMAALPAQVEAGASAGAAAGCAAGVGSISVTGTITTGTVMLNTGAIVGSLTPKLDLSLGGLYKRAVRG